MDFLPVIPRYTQKGCILPTLPTEPGATNGWLGYWALGATIIFTITVFVFEAVLDVRQRQSYMKTGEKARTFVSKAGIVITRSGAPGHGKLKI